MVIDEDGSVVETGDVDSGTERLDFELTAGRRSYGRLLLVAPNIVQVERELEVDEHDFRLWVCLHEETHRVQFTAVPWLRDHLRSEIGLFLDQAELDASAYAAMFREAVQRLGRSVFPFSRRGRARSTLARLQQTAGAQSQHTVPAR